MRTALREQGQTQAEYGVVLAVVTVTTAAMFVVLCDRVIATVGAALRLLG
jgi:Flp pilus assembly pilin Flp